MPVLRVWTLGLSNAWVPRMSLVSPVRTDEKDALLAMQESFLCEVNTAHSTRRAPWAMPSGDVYDPCEVRLQKTSSIRAFPFDLAGLFQQQVRPGR